MTEGKVKEFTIPGLLDTLDEDPEELLSDCKLFNSPRL